MKRRHPFKVGRIENRVMNEYEITTKDDMVNTIINWINSFVSDNGIKKHNERTLVNFLNEMTTIYGKFLDHYDMSYNFVSYHMKIAKALRELGISPWQDNEPNPKT